MKKHFLLMGSLLLSSAMAFGAAFQLNLQGARQLAMGGTGTAVPWDASTIFYNPGGLSSLKYVQGYVGVQALIPNMRYVETPTGTYTAETQAKTYTPFNLYLGGPINFKNKLSLGIGIYTPFGTGVKWDNNWRGRYVIQDIQMQTIFFQPTVSYRFNDVISIGAGFVFATGNVKIQKAVPLQTSGQDGQAELKGDAKGVGYNVGVHMRATDWLQFGVSYRSGVKMKVKRGYASFNVPASVSASFPYTAFSSTLNLPNVISVGIGIKATERLSITADANFVGWSKYDTLAFDYETNTSSLMDTKSPRRYKSTLALRLGGSYAISDKFTAMLGGAYDPSPVRDGYVSPDLPDANHIMVTGGLAFKPVKRLSIIGVFEYVITEKRTGAFTEAGFEGKYDNRIVNPGLALTYDF
jgi:long-chain fatty acid transport protein